jgi:hypothetical protein
MRAGRWAPAVLFWSTPSRQKIEKSEQRHEISLCWDTISSSMQPLKMTLTLTSVHVAVSSPHPGKAKELFHVR